VTAGTFLGHVCPRKVRQSAVLVETREGQVWVGADVPTAREQTGCFLWVCTTVLGCWMLPRLSLSGDVVTPVDMLAIEVANVETAVWERRDGRRSESRAWRFVDVDNLVTCDVYAQPLSL